MPHQPFFSIIIPTRDRPLLLKDALVSVIRQNFDNFEVIVSDNFSDNQTQIVLDEFKGDARLRCIRTDRLLQMPEHWDFATQHSHGKYVLILTDRSVLKQGALKTIHEAITSYDTPVDVCSWRWSVYNENAGREYEESIRPVLEEGSINNLCSVELLEDFASGLGRYYKSWPRGMNSCYDNSFMKRMRNEFGTPFKQIHADYSLAFASLGLTQEVLFIDQVLYISQGLDVSTGTMVFKGIGTASESYYKSLGEMDLYAHVPIKAEICHNLIYEDFFVAQKRYGGNLKKLSNDWPGYFKYCYDELLQKKNWGNMSPEALQDLFTEWERALSTFDLEIQSNTRKKIKELSQSLPSQSEHKPVNKVNLMVQLVGQLKKLLYGMFKFSEKQDAKVSLSQKEQPVRSALELAGF